MMLSLRRKIILLVMGVVAALVITSAVFLDRWVRSEVHARLDADLAGGQRALQEVLQARAERLAALCGSLAAAPRFKAAIEETDRQTVEDTGRDEMKLVGADLLLVTDARGKELGRISAGPLPATAPALASALAKKPASDVWQVAGQLYQVSCQPITYGDTVSGVLTLGHRLDDATALRLADLVNAYVVLATEAGPAAASTDRAFAAEAAKAAADVAPSVPGAKSRTAQRNVSGQACKVLVVSLRGHGGQPVGRVVLLRSLDVALGHLRQIQKYLMLAACVVGLLGVGLAALLGRAITRPLEDLMQSTRELEAGNYDVPVKVASSDELGLLAGRFEEMRKSLHANIQRLVEEERLRSQMEVERHRSLSQMVAGVAHEINTPLGIVNQAASILTESLSPSAIAVLAKDEDARTSLADLTEAARLIQNNIARADHLIQSFKNLSVRQVTDNKEAVDLPALVEEIVGLFRIRAKLAKIQVQETEALGTERTWTGYPGYLSQVLMNLLSNTERYAYPGGKGGVVEVALAHAELDGRPAFSLAVQDHGAGIAPENISRVFEVFFTTGRGKGGSGLGLAIVDNLVRSALEGTITVASPPGEGACFTVVVPREVKGTAGH